MFALVWVDLCACKTWMSVLRKAEPVQRGRTPGFPGNPSAIVTSEKQGYLPASPSSLNVGISLLPQDASEESVILRVLISTERAVLQSCNQEPITDGRGVHKYLGTGMVTWITRQERSGTWEQRGMGCSELFLLQSS